ncbi:MAG: phosphatidate cytidylyltransferase [Candidatus Hydrogenedentota bacterium]
MSGMREEGAVLTRLATAVVLIPIVLALIWVPVLALPFALFVVVLAFLGQREFFQLAAHRGIVAEAAGGTAIATAIVLATLLQARTPVRISDVFLVGVLALGILHVWRGKHTLAGFGVSVLGLVYGGLFPAHFIMLHQHTFGPGNVTLLLAVVILSDTGAYFIGKTFGRHKFAPQVSPKKTWEGAAGGLVCGVLCAAVVYGLSRALPWDAFPAFTLPVYLSIGAALAVVSQMGDLVESMLKRDAGVKDAGALFPGHGGVLDRCDGFLFAGPALYYMLWAGQLLGAADVL